jgi:hypothetical protein
MLGAVGVDHLNREKVTFPFSASNVTESRRHNAVLHLSSPTDTTLTVCYHPRDGG